MVVKGKPTKAIRYRENEPIHEWFELSYSNYFVIPRSILQSMPLPWQRKFVKLMDEAEEMGVSYPDRGKYKVTLVTPGYGEDEEIEITDDLSDYERGRRRIKFPMGDK